jgi:glutathionyl-hydroquinone reductase
MAKDPNLVRLNLDIPWALDKRLKSIPWGLKSDVIRMLLAQFAEHMEKDGTNIAVYKLLNNKINPTEDIINKEDNNGLNRP